MHFFRDIIYNDINIINKLCSCSILFYDVNVPFDNTSTFFFSSWLAEMKLALALLLLVCTFSMVCTAMMSFCAFASNLRKIRVTKDVSFINIRGGQGSEAKNYYKILGVPEKATLDEIKQAYRKKALIMHPDKGGDPENFKLLNEAYEILSDDGKRRNYDNFGDDSTSKEFFERKFGGFGEFPGFSGFSGFSFPLVVRLQLSLEDLYFGKDLDITIGENSFRVHLSKGASSSHNILIQRDSSGKLLPRRIVLRVVQQDHSVFDRRGSDLITKLEINLYEALFGFERVLDHISGERVLLRSRFGEVLSSDDYLVFPSLGMPLENDPTKFGNLFAKIRVILPPSLDLSPQDKIDLVHILRKEVRISKELLGHEKAKKKFQEDSSNNSKKKLGVRDGIIGHRSRFKEEGKQEASDDSQESFNPFSNFFF